MIFTPKICICRQKVVILQTVSNEVLHFKFFSNTNYYA